jgi:hypothetical protein
MCSTASCACSGLFSVCRILAETSTEHHYRSILTAKVCNYLKPSVKVRGRLADMGSDYILKIHIDSSTKHRQEAVANSVHFVVLPGSADVARCHSISRSGSLGRGPVGYVRNFESILVQCFANILVSLYMLARFGQCRKGDVP